jgi:hypothetical protein
MPDSRIIFVSLQWIRTTSKDNKIMEQSPKTTGRMELAQRYFPNILPHSAWKKFKSLLEEEPSLCRLSTQRRRTYTPAEVNKIYQYLGEP